MRLSINYKDLDAISFAIDQIESDLESSNDEEWNTQANVALRQLYSICDRFKCEREKTHELNKIKKYIQLENPQYPKKTIDKLARLLVKKKREL